LFAVAIGAVATVGVAAIAAFEVVGSGEDEVWVFVVKVYRGEGFGA
jgi:hypothetical protein